MVGARARVRAEEEEKVKTAITLLAGDKDEEFSDKLDIYKHLAEVHSRISTDIGSDFVMSRLSDKDKEYVIEMITNAYFVKSIVTSIKTKTPEERTYVERVGGAVFDSCISKPYMINIMNRNVINNYLVRLLAGSPEEEKAMEEREEKKGVAKFLDGLKEKFGRKED